MITDAKGDDVDLFSQWEAAWSSVTRWLSVGGNGEIDEGLDEALRVVGNGSGVRKGGELVRTVASSSVIV